MRLVFVSTGALLVILGALLLFRTSHSSAQPVPPAVDYEAAAQCLAEQQVWRGIANYSISGAQLEKLLRFCVEVYPNSEEASDG